jgi:hypothetical protein
MTTEHVGGLQHSMTEDERPSGIPRRGHLGVAAHELILAMLALVALVALGWAFYLSSR